MKTCKKCNQMNPDTAKYCENCGSSDFIISHKNLDLKKVNPIKKFKTCPRCGEESPSTAVNCQYCGEKFYDEYEIISDDTATGNSEEKNISVFPQIKNTVVSTAEKIKNIRDSFDNAKKSEQSSSDSLSDQLDPSNEPNKKGSRLKQWQIRAILAACFVAVFFAGFGCGKINMVREETFYKVTKSYEDLLGENNYYKLRMAEYEKATMPSEQPQAVDPTSQPAVSPKTSPTKVPISTPTPIPAQTKIPPSPNTQVSGELTKSDKPTDGSPNFIEVLSYCETLLPKVLRYDASISLDENDTTIIRTGKRYKLETTMLKKKSDKTYHSAVFILEFNDDYSEYRMNTAEVDGVKYR